MQHKAGHNGRGRKPNGNGNTHRDRGILDEAGNQVSQLADWVRDESGEYINARKTEAAKELNKVGTAIREAADKLSDQNRNAIAKYVETAAEGIEEAGRYIKELQLDRFISDAETIARRQPAIFLGGMFVAGLAAARLVKVAMTTSSSERGNQRSGGRVRHRN